MSLLFSIAEQIESSALGVAIAESRFAYPVIEGIHLIGLAVSVGLIFLTDLRLMGLILAAMAVELLADGLTKLFPLLASPIAR